MNPADYLITKENAYIKQSGGKFDLYYSGKKQETLSKVFFRRLSRYLKRDGNKWTWDN